MEDGWRGQRVRSEVEVWFGSVGCCCLADQCCTRAFSSSSDNSITIRQATASDSDRIKVPTRGVRVIAGQKERNGRYN